MKKLSAYPACAQITLCISFLLLFPIRQTSAQAVLPVTSYKYRITQQVFKRLTQTFANGRPQPSLEIIARAPAKKKIIARYHSRMNQPVIQLDEEVYDLCTTLGRDSLNALAVLLGHELTHHYENHRWYNTFGIGQASGNLSSEEKRHLESEADFYGCFYGELAGYATGAVFPRLLDLVYQQFKLSSKLAGYPSKEERKATYQQKYKEAVSMMMVFRTGQFLYVMKEFAMASHCFQYLSHQFPSREMLTNLAAAKLQQALEIMARSEKPSFAYPIELDARSRLTTTHRQGISAENRTLVQNLLNEARTYASKAREIDPEYVPAYVNLACIYSLLGNQNFAIGVINELASHQLTGDAYTIRAIAYYQDKQFEKARQDFEAARQRKGYLAAYNLDLYYTLQASFTESIAGWIRAWFDKAGSVTQLQSPNPKAPEQIGGIAAQTPLPAQASLLKVSEKPYLLVKWEPGIAECKPTGMHIQVGDRNYRVIHTPELYTGKSAKGIGMYMPIHTLQETYGSPSFTLTSANGSFWVYKEDKIVFEVNAAEQVVSWFIFARVL